MMRANTKALIKQADIIINVPLEGYGSLDWRRSAELIEEGYRAAEAMRDALLPLAISEAEYAQWTAARQARRRTTLPVPAFTRVEGFSSSDERRLSTLLARHVGVAFDIDAVQTDLTNLSGLDRYETITWRIVSNAGRRERPAGRSAPQALRSTIPDAWPQSREHNVTGLPGHLHRTLSGLRPGRVRFRGPHRRDDRIGSGARRRTLPADPLQLDLSGAVRRRFAPDIRAHPERGHRRGVRRDADASGAEPRHESRTAERSAHRRLSRPAGRHGPGRRSRAACGQRRRRRSPKSSGG